MPITTGYRFGDIVLVPFPFTDQTTAKKRSAIVISSEAYHRDRRDVILIAVTSQTRPGPGIGEVAVERWEDAGLLKPSVVKPILATVDRDLILRKLGALREGDLKALQHTLSAILGG